jgi:hypothetical protein
MDVPIDDFIELSPNIEPPNVLPVVLLEIIDDFGNAKAEDPSTHHHHHQKYIMENILPPSKSLLHGMICWSGFERKQGSLNLQPSLVNLIKVEMEEVNLLC